MEGLGEVLVTGGAGFIGSNLVENLVGKAENVTVLDNLSTGSLENIDQVVGKINLVKASCSKVSALDGSPDLVYHLGIPSSSPLYKDDHLLVGKAINDFIQVFDFASENDAGVVYASTSSMYGPKDPPHREDMEFNPFDYYTEARLEMERLAEMYHKLRDVDSVGMRFFSVYGPHELAKENFANIISQFCWKIMGGENPVIYGDGEQTRDFTHVKDVVRALTLAGKKAGELGCDIINVGTGEETSFNEVVEKLNGILGKDVEPNYVENPIDNYVKRTKADTSKAKERLGFEAEIDVDEGMRKTVQYYDGKLD